MKTIFSIITLLLAGISMFAAETTVWEGSQKISWSTDYEGTQVDTYNTEGFTGIFANLAANDIIRLYVTPGDNTQYSYKYKVGNEWTWTELAFTSGDGVQSYTVADADVATLIKERGLVISGQDYTLTKITVETPSSGSRTENAKKLYDLLTSLYGKKIISGTTARVDWNTEQAEQVYGWTGKYPAINTYDFINIHASKDVNTNGWLDYSDISGVKKWAAEGGLVSAMWHWQVKANNGTDYTCTPGTGDAATSFDASKVYEDGTEENTLAKAQLAQVSGYLKKMQDAGIPVIWRPLHEAAGNTYEFDGGTAWFWWGAKGAEVYKKLWQWMYDYMTDEQGLQNLIWVWTSQTGDADWYPGDAYVDIIGRDAYGTQAAAQKSDFDALTTAYNGKVIALSECGNTTSAAMSNISDVWQAGAKWGWFSTWYDSAENSLHNTKSWWEDVFRQDYVITRAQMKQLVDFGIESDPSDDGPTAIGEAVVDASGKTGAQVTYDLQGRRIGNYQLNKGMYIINGKKVVK